LNQLPADTVGPRNSAPLEEAKELVSPPPSQREIDGILDQEPICQTDDLNPRRCIVRTRLLPHRKLAIELLGVDGSGQVEDGETSEKVTLLTKKLEDGANWNAHVPQLALKGSRELLRDNT